MLLTRIWAAVLSLLATAFLAGMFLLSVGTSGGFTESDRTAIRAVTEAGLAAFEADIQSSPASLGPSLLTDSRLKEAMEREPDDEGEGLDLQGTLILVANDGLLEEHPLMSVALIDKAGAISAKTGLDEGVFDELTKLGAFTTAQASNDAALFSATLGGKLFAVKVSRPETGTQARRLVAVQPVDLGGGSFLRRVLGTSNPAGLVRDGELLGEAIGGANPSELQALVTNHVADTPPEGSSQVFEVGEGGNKRLGALGRVPGPAGKGEHGTLFAVLSLNTEGATQRDLAQALSDAMDKGMGQVSWPLILGLLVVSLALSFYLPHLESAAPLRRLTAEFLGMAQGSQHQIFHDTYGGQIGQLARAAVQAQEGLRAQWEAEMDGEAFTDEDVEEERPRVTRRTRSVRNTRGTRRAGRTRRNEAVKEEPEAPAAIELPDAPDDAVLEGTAHGSKAPAPSAGPADFPDPNASHSGAPAPTLHDDIDEDAASMLGGSLGGGEPPADAPTLMPEPEPPPPPVASPPPPAPAPASAPDDPREAYYHEIYNEFVETKKTCGENLAGFTYEKFAKKLRKNTADLMKRPGIKDVKFSVYVKDGKAALKAKVVKE